MKKVLYWFLSLTWGIIMTLIGSVVILALLITGHKVKRFGYDLYVNVGERWGGTEFGPFFLVDSSDDYKLKCHEHGHGFQNCKFGPIYPFLIGIPSAARYWLRRMCSQKAKYIYTALLTACFIAIGAALTILGLFINSTISLIIGLFTIAYFVILGAWLASIETPRYKNNNYVEYDSFWLEGDATRTGTEFMKSLQQKENAK